MFTYGKSRAEEQLSLLQSRTARIQTEKDDVQQQQKEHREKLRALRRAKEAAEKKS